MKTCKGCGLDAVDPQDVPRYDVLNTEYDPEVDQMGDFGPYCQTCFAETTTGQFILAQP